MKNNILKISSVAKHHNLIQAYYENCGLNEQKIFNFLIYSIKNRTITDNVLITSYKEITDFLGYKINHKCLKNSLVKLMTIVLEVALLSKDKKAYKLTHFIEKVENENKVINIKLSDEFISMILNDKKRYCYLNFALINKFKSKYTIRLYENIMRYMTRSNSFIHMPKMDINTFKKLMGITEKEYKRMSHFKASVIEVAVNEINKKTDIKISYELFKIGNTYTDILFHSKFKNLSANIVETALFYGDEKVLDFIDIFLPKYADNKVIGLIDNKEVYFQKINNYGGKRLVIKDTIGETTLNHHISMEILTSCYENREKFDWFDKLDYEEFLHIKKYKKFSKNFR